MENVLKVRICLSVGVAELRAKTCAIAPGECAERRTFGKQVTVIIRHSAGVRLHALRHICPITRPATADVLRRRKAVAVSIRARPLPSINLGVVFLTAGLQHGAKTTTGSHVSD
jgi:hypothetical protein